MVVRFGKYFRPYGLRPELSLVFPLVVEWARDMGVKVLWVSSGSDRKHSKRSLHYKGLAFDIVTDPTELMIGQYVAALQERVGNEYDVVGEGNHIHIEYDPDYGVNLP